MIWPILRSALALGVGIVVAWIIISSVQAAGHLTHDLPPPNADFITDEGRAAFVRYVSELPVHAFGFVIAAYLLGTISGCYVAGRLAPLAPNSHAWAVGAVLWVMGMVNLWLLPHPIWVGIAVALTFPLAALAAIYLLPETYKGD